MSDPRYINCGASEPVTAPGELYGFLRLRLERPLVYLHWGPRDMREDAEQFARDLTTKANNTVAPVEFETGAQPESPFFLLDVRSYASGATLTVAELVYQLDPIAKNAALVIASVERIDPDRANDAERDAAVVVASTASQGPRSALDGFTAGAKWAVLALVALVLLVVAGETKKLVA